MHILDLNGKRIKSYKPHLASIIDISMDSTGDFVSTASLDGERRDLAYVLFSYPLQGRLHSVPCPPLNPTPLI